MIHIKKYDFPKWEFREIMFREDLTTSGSTAAGR